MCSLDLFPSFPEGNLIPICETEGRIQYTSPDCANLSVYTNLLLNYPNIEITREMLHPGNVHTIFDQVFLPVEQTFWKRLRNTWYEDGLMEVLKVAASEPENSDSYNLVCLCAQKILSMINMCYKLNSKVPFLSSKDPEIDQATLNTNWIRCVDWHPHCTKIAIATRDDSVRIYSADRKLTPLLKCKTQRNILSLAWRPLSASDIAVGCEDGIYIWVVDPSSVVMRPSASSSATLLQKPNHKNICSLSWSPQGDILVSASKFDRAMYVWEVSTERSVSLKCVGGGGISLVSYSPNCSKLFAAANKFSFRVWDTKVWEPEMWSLQSGRITNACWSSCGSILLFTTSSEAMIYAMTFGDMGTVFNSEHNKSAVALIDVTAKSISSGERVGGDVMEVAWDPTNHYLAISFKNSDIIAIFLTKISASTVHVAPRCFIKGSSGEVPIKINFQNNFESGANLTIAWSSQRLQYFPFIFSDLKVKGSSPQYKTNGTHSTCIIYDGFNQTSQLLNFNSY